MQEINLYQPVSKGVRGALSASSSRATLLLIAVTLSAIWGIASWQVDHLRKAASAVRAQQQAQAAMTAAAGPQLDALSDEEIEALVAKLSASVETKSRAMALLAGESASHAAFSARLRAFGTRHIEGIWLEHLTFGAGAESISLSGSTLAPEFVPRYLKSLAADPALKGGQIDEFVIEKPVPDKNSGKHASADGRLTFKAGHRGLEPRDLAAVGEEST